MKRDLLSASEEEESVVVVVVVDQWSVRSILRC